MAFAAAQRKSNGSCETIDSGDEGRTSYESWRDAVSAEPGETTSVESPRIDASIIRGGIAIIVGAGTAADGVIAGSSVVASDAGRLRASSGTVAVDTAAFSAALRVLNAGTAAGGVIAGSSVVASFTEVSVVASDAGRLRASSGTIAVDTAAFSAALRVLNAGTAAGGVIAGSSVVASITKVSVVASDAGRLRASSGTVAVDIAALSAALRVLNAGELDVRCLQVELPEGKREDTELTTAGDGEGVRFRARLGVTGGSSGCDSLDNGEGEALGTEIGAAGSAEGDELEEAGGVATCDTGIR
jgi:hypothetical protein